MNVRAFADEAERDTYITNFFSHYPQLKTIGEVWSVK